MSEKLHNVRLTEQELYALEVVLLVQTEYVTGPIYGVGRAVREVLSAIRQAAE